MGERDWLGGWLWAIIVVIALAAFHGAMAECLEPGNWCSVIERGE